MTNQQIIDLFDSTNITLAELSRITGKSVSYLKQILMGQS
jgi:predicted HTH domain antitoxin